MIGFPEIEDVHALCSLENGLLFHFVVIPHPSDIRILYPRICGNKTYSNETNNTNIPVHIPCVKNAITSGYSVRSVWQHIEIIQRKILKTNELSTVDFVL